MSAVRLCAIIFAVWLAVPATAGAQDRVPVGQVVQQRGTVTVLREPVAILIVGSPVYRADRIVTGPASRVKLQLADGTVVAIGSDSDLTVAEHAAVTPVEAGIGGRARVGLSLMLGIIRAVLPPAAPGAGFTVQGRTAIASARSTDFVVVAEPDNTAVFVAEGSVAVAARPLVVDGMVDRAAAGAAVVLGPGEGTDVPLGGPPSPPAVWGQRRVDDVIARTQVP